MPSAANSRSTPPRLDPIDNYNFDDLSDDPFKTPSPTAESKKRKEPASGLGIDEEVSVQKRARIPNVKLDEARLLGANGIPKLKKRAAGLKLKGKGHEFSDASRLLSFYQLWLDDLFPKARFRDALTMIEKLGHKKQVMAARNEWINESKPKSKDADEYEDLEGRIEDVEAPTTLVERPKTPARNGDDVPDDDDLYDATPRRAPPVRDEPDEDDLEALMAEAGGQDFSRRNARPLLREGPEGDELDALIAEAEGQDGEGSQAKEPTSTTRSDFEDEEAAMQEMEGLW